MLFRSCCLHLSFCRVPFFETLHRQLPALHLQLKSRAPGGQLHQKPEILIVDEVLAVGDAEFQKKALGKMKDVSNREGRTVLFVSHNMAAVKNLCTRGILLINGTVAAIGTIDETINQYHLSNQSTVNEINNYNRKGSGECRVNKINILSVNETDTGMHKLGDKISIEIYISNFSGKALNDLQIIIGIYNLNDEGYLRFDTRTTNAIISIAGDSVKVVCSINEHLNIKPDQYSLNIAVLKDAEMLDYVPGAAKFSIENYDYYGTGRTIPDPELSKVFYKHSWEII